MSKEHREVDNLDETFAGLTDAERLDKAWRMLVHLEVINQAIRAGKHAATPATALWVDSASFVLRMILDGRPVPSTPKNQSER